MFELLAVVVVVVGVAVAAAWILNGGATGDDSRPSILRALVAPAAIVAIVIGVVWLVIYVVPYVFYAGAFAGGH